MGVDNCTRRQIKFDFALKKKAEHNCLLLLKKDKKKNLDLAMRVMKA